MLKKFYKVILVLLIGIFFFGDTLNVAAEVKAREIAIGESYYYYSTKDGNYGSYAGTTDQGANTKVTKYKHINNNPAYCVQSENYAPDNGETYYEVPWGTYIEGQTWNEEKALISGALMEVIDNNYSGGEAYVNTYSVLNSYLDFSRSIDFSSYNTKFANYIKEAKSQLGDEIRNDYVIPSFSAKANDSKMAMYTSGSETYYTGSFTLSGLVSSYGGDDVTYKFDSLPSGVTLYTDSGYTKKASSEYTSISGRKTFYVKATGVNAGSEIKITTRASNESTYYIGRLWRPVSTTSNKQLLITLGVYDYERVGKAVVTFDIPDASSKTIKLVKKDAATGDYLKGSNLKLQLSGASNDSCTIAGDQYSCSISVDETKVGDGDINYSVVESVAPNGYILGEAISNVKWDINASTSVCYAMANNNTIATDLEDCNRNYINDTICTLQDGTIKTGACEMIVDPSLPEDTPDDQKTYIPVGTEEKACYYLNGESVVKVDGSKCSNQYMKVTNSGGNLTVEYYNKKNEVEISKFAINGDKELLGAELKICSNKPDAKGNCTIVRNTHEGRCANTATTEEGYLGLTNEFNCVNNDDGTKTVDMHWFSVSSPRIWYGLTKGTYYLVETVAPSGFLPLTTSIEFKVAADGTITSEAYDSETKKIIVRNKPTSFKIIKQDAVTGKNLSGAILSICTAYKNEEGVYQLNVGNDGYCVPAVLSDGTSVTFTTGDKEQVISGLGIGTYYLVEIKAPDNYSIANAILFTVNSDGTISDKDGNLIKNNELIMKDDPIVNEKTGELPILTIILIGLGAVAVCGGSYYYLIKKNGLEILKNKFKKK